MYFQKHTNFDIHNNVRKLIDLKKNISFKTPPAGLDTYYAASRCRGLLRKPNYFLKELTQNLNDNQYLPHNNKEISSLEFRKKLLKKELAHSSNYFVSSSNRSKLSEHLLNNNNNNNNSSLLCSHATALKEILMTCNNFENYSNKLIPKLHELNDSRVMNTLLKHTAKDNDKLPISSQMFQYKKELVSTPLMKQKKDPPDFIKVLNPMRTNIDVLQIPLSPPRRGWLRHSQTMTQLGVNLVPNKCENYDEDHAYTPPPIEPDHMRSQFNINMSSCFDPFQESFHQERYKYPNPNSLFLSHLANDICPMHDNVKLQNKTRFISQPHPDELQQLI